MKDILRCFFVANQRYFETFFVANERYFEMFFCFFYIERWKLTGKACLVNLSQSLSIQPFSDYIYDDNDDGDDDSDARTGGVFNDDNGDSADDVGGILNNDDDDSDDDVGGVFNTQHVFNHQISYEMRSPLGNQWDAGKGKLWRKCK